MRNIRFCFWVFVCLALIPRVLHAQISQSVKVELQWNGVAEFRNGNDTLYYIALEDGNYNGPLPSYNLSLPIYDDAVKATVELAVMGVKQPYHRQGLGRALFAAAKQYAVQAGYAFMQVKTVKMGLYEDYDRTNLFYQSLGFREFEVFPTLWDENNPCQIYVMYLPKDK